MKEYSRSTAERVFSESLYSFASADDRLLVAFSGGCDSLALLRMCVSLHGADKVFPVYVNHNIRPSSELEAEIALNKSNCALAGVPLCVRTITPSQLEDVKSRRRGGTEDAARFLRYAILEEERQRLGASWILTAHHRNDQNETILMRLASKAPLCSMRGILKVSGHVGRPLLELHRCDLESYVSEIGLQWSTDSTNSDCSYRRNEIRNKVVPILECEHPDYEGYLEQMRLLALRLWDSIPDSEVTNPVDIGFLKSLEDDAREMFIFRMWDKVMPSVQLPQTLVARVMGILDKDCANASSNGGTFTTYAGRLYLSSASEDVQFERFSSEIASFDDLKLELPGGYALLSGAKASPSEHPEKDIMLDASRLRGKVVARFARQGDRIFLKDGGKTVLRLLQDMKVAPALRKRALVLEDEKGIQAVFASHLGGRNRISASMRGDGCTTRCVLAYRAK